MAGGVRDAFDDEGEAVDYFDVHNYIALCREHYDAVGIGADQVDKLFR